MIHTADCDVTYALEHGGPKDVLVCTCGVMERLAPPPAPPAPHRTWRQRLAALLHRLVIRLDPTYDACEDYSDEDDDW